ncbi:MAG: polysaccharide pyruvyl transferase CsaB [Bacillota bacterium]
MKKIFMFGYYGFDNAGDESILKAIVNSLNSKKVNFDILTYNYKKTKKNFNVNPISRSKFKDIIFSIKSSDLVIGGGGSLLQDITSSKSLYYYLAIILISKLFGKKVIFLFSGIGPVNKSFNQKLLKWVLNKVDYIVLRDYKSEKFLKKLNIKTEMEVSADAAFLLNTSKNKKVDKKIVGISLRPWTHNELVLKEIKKMIKYLIKKDYNIKLIPLMIPDDLEYTKRLEMKFGKKIELIDKNLTIEKYNKEIQKCDFIIGMRLHSLIFSAINETPFIGIEYDPKIDSFTEMTNQINCCKVKDISFEKLKNDILNMENNLEKFQKNIIKENKNMKKSVRKIIKKVNDKFLY